MNIVTTRFGLIQASESELYQIPEGLLGFRSYTQYFHLADPMVTGLTWLQSVTAPDWWRLRWRSATTGSRSARVTGRSWSWRMSETR